MGGLEIQPIQPVSDRSINRRMGGLESTCNAGSRTGYINRRMGGLEIQPIQPVSDRSINRRMGGLEMGN